VVLDQGIDTTTILTWLPVGIFIITNPDFTAFSAHRGIFNRSLKSDIGLAALGENGYLALHFLPPYIKY